MKPHIAFIILGLLLFNVSFGASAPSDLTAIKMYTKPSMSAKVINTYSPTQKRLTPFYYPKDHPDWAKVGDIKTGAIGWVSAKQRRRALKAYYEEAGIEQETSSDNSATQSRSAPSGSTSRREQDEEPTIIVLQVNQNDQADK